jgi:hypothetical protein
MEATFAVEKEIESILFDNHFLDEVEMETE